MSYLISLHHLLSENIAHVGSFSFFVFVFVFAIVFYFVFVFVFVFVFFEKVLSEKINLVPLQCIVLLDGLGWKSLCGTIIRASLCDANNQRNGDVTYRLSFATWTGLAVAVFPLLENWACKNWKIIG